jgi:hypothetical protein
MTPDSWASFNKGLSMAAPKKPEGWNKFNQLARGLVKADPAAVEKKLAANKKARAKRKKKK